MTRSPATPTATSSRRIRFRQRVLIDTTGRSMEAELLGSKLSMPVAIAPTGLTGLVYGDGEMLAARAAEAEGTVYTLSTMSICTIEDVRAVTQKPFWFQLYVFRDRGFCEEIIGRARDAGCPVLFVTVDLPQRGQRHADLKNGLTVPPRLTLRNAFDIATKPAWVARVLMGKRKTFGNVEHYLKKNNIKFGTANWSQNHFDQSLNWRDIDWIRKIWPGKLVLKGILDVDDAKTAVAAGADGIVVSNHGGRQLDGAPATVRVLPEIAERGRRPHRGAVRRRHPLRPGRDEGARARRARLPDRPRLSVRPRRHGRSRRAQGGRHHPPGDRHHDDADRPARPEEGAAGDLVRRRRRAGVSAELSAARQQRHVVFTSPLQGERERERSAIRHASRGPHGPQKLVHRGLEAAAFARQRLGRGQHLGGCGAGLVRAAAHIADVVGDAPGSGRRLVDVAGDVAGGGALLIDGRGDRLADLGDLGDRAADGLDRPRPPRRSPTGCR